MEGFVREEGEGEGFFGVGGDVEFIRSDDVDVRKSCGELGEEKRILCAAAGDDELVDFVFGKNETVQCINDGERGEKSSGADEVVRFGVMFLAECEKFFGVGGAVIFAAGGLGRREL